MGWCPTQAGSALFLTLPRMAFIDTLGPVSQWTLHGYQVDKVNHPNLGIRTVSPEFPPNFCLLVAHSPVTASLRLEYLVSLFAWWTSEEVLHVSPY